MNTCKDCLCYAACNYHIDEETSMTVNECSTGFMSRNEYVKLPVYIGQPIWSLKSKYQWVDEDFKLFGYELENGKVSMIQQKADKSWKFRVTIAGSVSDYTLSDVGNNIFFSAAEAIEEQHRREREFII